VVVVEEFVKLRRMALRCILLDSFLVYAAHTDLLKSPPEFGTYNVVTPTNGALDTHAECWYQSLMVALPTEV
jgi:hypothetical protein